jgi:hypothetical protein
MLLSGAASETFEKRFFGDGDPLFLGRLDPGFAGDFDSLEIYNKLTAIQLLNNPAISLKGVLAGANVAGIGTIAWSNPGNVTALDATYADVVLAAGEVSNYLKGTGIAPEIPDDAIITNIEVRFHVAVGDPVTADITTVQLVVGGAIVGNNLGDSATWVGTKIYSGTTGLAGDWGVTVTPAELRAADFGFVISITDDGSAGTYQVDYMTVSVEYYIPLVILPEYKSSGGIWENTALEDVRDKGTATSGAVGSMTDTGAAWTVNEFIFDETIPEAFLVNIYDGTGAGQTRIIASNTATVITPRINFSPAPDATSKYRIFKAMMVPHSGNIASKEYKEQRLASEFLTKLVPADVRLGVYREGSTTRDDALYTEVKATMANTDFRMRAIGDST